jgi:hypothetical protein
VSATCYMCNAVATSQEHAPPACIFPESKLIGKDLRKNLITVPSCDLHNSKKSEDDEFLRATICLTAAGSSEVATHQFSEKVLKGAKRSLAKYRSFAPRANVTTPPGKSAFTTDRVRFDRCIEHIAKAICFHNHGVKWLLPIAVISPQLLTTSSSGQLIGHEPSLSAAEATRSFLAMQPVQGENPEVFMYRVKIEEDMFAFAALFYGSVEVFAASSPEIAAGGA